MVLGFWIYEPFCSETNAFLVIVYFVRYLHRLDESLDEITDIQSGKVHTATHYRHQYASREDKIRETIVRERQVFNSSGIGKVCSAVLAYVSLIQ